jgi:hypothetical protein
MKRASKLATICLTVLGAAVLLTGCKASKCLDANGQEVPNCLQVQSLKKYVGQYPVTGSAAWSAGKSITINNGNGLIVVDATSGATEVTASAIAFDMETADGQGKATAISVIDTQLHLVVGADGTGNVVVNGDGTGNRGFELTVHLPSTFDGALTVVGNSGDVTVNTAATSTSTTVSNNAGDIVVHNAVGHLVITGKASAIEVAAAPSLAGNSIKTDVGDINATISSSVNLGITAVCDNGTVTLASSMTNATLAADKMSAGITLGDGSGTLSVQSGLGDIIFH